MLSRVLVDIYHLKRIHMTVADKSLADTLKSKICRLNLKPAVAELHRQRAVQPATSRNATTGALDKRRRRTPSSGATTSASHPRALPSSARGDALDHTFVQSDAAWTTLPDPPSIGFLLECIAYFDLGDAPVTADALELAKAALPFMSSTLACTTLAACCALGHDKMVDGVMPLLVECLAAPSEAPEAQPHMIASATPSASTGGRTHHGLLHSGSITLRFIEALRRVGVTREEVWTAVAKHCVRCLPTLDGKEVVHLIELFYEQRMLCYPAVYAAVESHVMARTQRSASTNTATATSSRGTGAQRPQWTAQVSGVPYLSPAQIQQLLFYYHELGLPTTAWHPVGAQSFQGRDFDSALDLAVSQGDLVAPRPHATLFTARHSQPENRLTRSTTTASRRGPSPTADTAVDSRLDAFLNHASDLFLHADPEELLALIGKCATSHVMHPVLMETAVTRMAQLYFSDHVPTANTTVTSPSDSVSPRAVEQTALPASLRTEQSQQPFLDTLTMLLRFEDARLFAHCRQRVADMLNVVAHEAAVMSMKNLSLAYGAATLLPPPSTSTEPATSPADEAPYRPPTQFFEALIQQLQRARDATPHENHARLLQLVRTLQALESLGGRALLVQHLPSITIAATHAPRAVQVELLAALSGLPEAASALVPALLQSLGPVRDKPTWYRVMSPGEVRVLLDALMRIRSPAGRAVREATDPRIRGLSSAARDQATTAPTAGADAAQASHREDAVPARTQRLSAALLDVDGTDTPTAMEGHVRADGGAATATATATAALMTGIVAFIKEEKAHFEPADLTRHLHSLAVLGYRELDFFASTASHLLNVAASTELSTVARTSRREGVSVGRVPTSVHDLSLLLYTSTFVVHGVVRVTQQILGRLKVSLSQTTPHDVSLILYSLARLNVARPRELSRPLCDRAVVVLTDFTASELASVWSSLRALGDATDGFLQATKDVLSGTANAPRLARLNAVQRLTITAAVVAVSQHMNATAAGGVAQDAPGRLASAISAAATATASSGGRRGGRDSLVDQLSRMSDPALTDARRAEVTVPPALFSTNHILATESAPQTTFLTAVLAVARTRQLSGLQLTLAVSTLAAMPLITLSLDAWCLLAAQADRLCHTLGTATAQASTAVELTTSRALGAAEVLLALVHLHGKLETAISDRPTSTRKPQPAWQAMVARWPHATPPVMPSPLDGGNPRATGAADAQACPLPPVLLRFVRDHMTLIAGAPLLKEHLRPLLTVGDTDGPAEGSLPVELKKKKKVTAQMKRATVAPPTTDITNAPEDAPNLNAGDVMTF